MKSEEVLPEETRAFIERVVASESFKKKKALRDFLLFLLEKQEELLSSIQLEELLFRRLRTSGELNEVHARERASTLRRALRGYEAENPDDPIRCELPNADDVGGYQLRLYRVMEQISVCRRFWGAHLESEKETMVACDPLLFYWDRDSGMMLRFMDTNIEGLSRGAALQELENRHESEHKETLIPGHFYIDVGSVMAADAVREFFRESGKHVPLVMDKQADRQWLKASPIVIGNVRTNTALKRLFGSSDTKGFAYRLDETRFGWLNIRSRNQKEIDALKKIDIKMDVEGNFQTAAEKVTIGIVTRMPNPRGAGVMTFISSDGTFTTRQIAAAVTQESQLRPIFAQMGWRLDRPVPETFEMMFLVHLWPGDSEDEGSEAKLICWRP